MEPRATSSVSAASKRLRHHERAGFSIVELLVVIGVIAILLGLLTPALYRAYKQAQRTRFASELQVISQALEAYKSDFGDYPRGIAATGFPAGYPDLGAVTLGWALIGPGPNYPTTASGPLVWPPCPPHPPGFWSNTETYTAGEWVNAGGATFFCLAKNTNKFPSGNPAFWTLSGPVTPYDGADGPGFRPKSWIDFNGNTQQDDPSTGRVYGPYVQPEKFKVSGMAILDPWGYPILYFPAAPGKPNISLPNAYIDSTMTPSNKTQKAARVMSLYDAADNLTSFGHSSDPAGNYSNAFIRIQAMLGDRSLNGAIDGGETAATTSGFILWSAGPDGFFGPKFTGAPTSTDVSKCDDVTNFQQ